MYYIHLRGPQKAVYMIRHNLVGFGLPEIVHEEGTNERFIMHCQLETRHDAIPNEHGGSLKRERWDKKTVDLTDISFEDIKAGQYDAQYIDHELGVLSGMFGVEIELLNDPDDKWWLDMGCEPEYPFYAYSKGKETKDLTVESDDPSVFSF